MLRKLLRKVKGLFKGKSAVQEGRSQPKLGIGEMNGNVKILTQSQLDKQTDFKIGESYRLGEAIVTLRASKAEVQAIIEAADKRRAAKEKRLRERAIDIMLMSPEELLQLQVKEWLAERAKVDKGIMDRMGFLGFKRYIPPVERQPSGKLGERFANLMEDVEVAEKVRDE